MSEEQKKAIFRKCDRFLTHHHRCKPQKILADLEAAASSNESSDFYGKGEAIEEFEHEVVSLLGKEASVFMPSGTMAQNIALRIWSEEKKNKMHLYVSADPKSLERNILEKAKNKKIALFRNIETLHDGRAKLEFVVGDATLDFSKEEIFDLICEMIRG